MPATNLVSSTGESAPGFFDAHNHLQDSRFGGRQPELIPSAIEVGIKRMVVNGACEADWPQVQALAGKFPLVLPSFGYHPWYVHERTPAWREHLVHFLDETPGAVIGEIGLDRWKSGLAYDGQEEVFAWQLELAAGRDVAASIHCLEAWGRLYDLLRANHRPARGFLLHSYGGPVEMVAPLAKLGAYFGFPGYYLHERKTRQRETFRSVPPDRLLIETDAPDQRLPEALIVHALADPVIGTPLNHPANLPEVYRGLAEFLRRPVNAMAGEVEENFSRLFG